MAGPWPGRRQRPRIQGANLGPGQTRAGGGPGPGPVAVWGSGSFAGGGSGKPQGGHGLIRSGECSILTSRMCSLQDPEGTHEKSIFDRHPRTRGGLEFLQLYCTRNVHNHQTILLATRLKGPSSRSCSRAH